MELNRRPGKTGSLAFVSDRCVPDPMSRSSDDEPNRNATNGSSLGQNADSLLLPPLPTGPCELPAEFSSFIGREVLPAPAALSCTSTETTEFNKRCPDTLRQ